MSDAEKAAFPAAIHPTAEIIPLPVRQQPIDRRLRAALTRLGAALGAQREAVANLRGSLVDLQAAVGSVGASVRGNDDAAPTGAGHPDGVAQR